MDQRKPAFLLRKRKRSFSRQIWSSPDSAFLCLAAQVGKDTGMRAALKSGHLTGPHQEWMASKESHHFHTHAHSCPVHLLAPVFASVSLSASNLETSLLTLLSHPWPQWLLKQAPPAALPTSVEICVPSLSSWMSTTVPQGGGYCSGKRVWKYSSPFFYAPQPLAPGLLTRTCCTQSFP